MTRSCLPLDLDWHFTRQRASAKWMAGQGDDRGEPVDLPHCWNSQDTFQLGVDYHRGDGAYRKRFRIPEGWIDAEDDSWFLETDGFYGLGEVWLNGVRLARVDGQYLGFRLDASRLLEMRGANLLAVRIANRRSRNVLPGRRKEPDFVLFGGLAGRMRLCRIPALHLNAHLTRIAGRDLLDRTPRVAIEYQLENSAAARRVCRVEWQIRDAQGQRLAHHETGPIVMGEHSARDLQVELDIPSPRLWSDRAPHLYRAEVSVRHENEEIDTGSWTFGLRQAEFRAGQGFFLNGERCVLRGCNRHESIPGIGNALADRQHREDAETIKEMGLNFVRLSHYPQHPRFLDACDELGILVYSEIASWKSVRAGKWLAKAARQMHDMILRDRNHPSIILWGMGNESRSRKAFLELKRIAKEADPTRPVTYAENHLYRARRARTTGIPDVWGLNYELDALDEGRRASQLENVVVAECMRHATSTRGDWEEESQQVETIKSDLMKIDQKPWVAGFAIWSFNDYSTVYRKRYRRLAGLLDAWRQPKMAADLLRALYRDEPVLEIHGDWSTYGASSRRRIDLFTNCEQVILRHRGRDLETLVGGPHHTLELVFRPGALVAEGVFKGSRPTAHLPSHGRAMRIDIALDRTWIDPGERLTHSFEVRLLDEIGALDRNWNGEISIQIEGPGRLRSFTPADQVLVSRGTGRGYFVATGEEGSLRITASGDGLISGESTIECARPTARSRVLFAGP